MAGFMAGFGTAFTKGLQEGDERRFQERQDQFKMTYGEYLKRRDAKEEKDRETQKEVKGAKALAQQYGAPEGAWKNILEWKEGGQTDEFISKQLKGGSWTKNEPSTPSPSKGGTVNPVQPNVPAEEAPSGAFPTAGMASQAPQQPVDAQMQTSGIAPAPTPAPAPAPAPEAPQQKGMFPNLLSGLSGKFKDDPNKKHNQAVEKIAQGTGQSVEEVQSVFKPEAAAPDTTSEYIFTPSIVGDAEDETDLTTENKALVAFEDAKAAVKRDPSDANLARLSRAEAANKAYIDRKVLDEDIKQSAAGKAMTGDSVAIYDAKGYVGLRPMSSLEPLEGGGYRDKATNATVTEARPVTKESIDRAAQITDKLQPEMTKVLEKQGAASAAIKTFEIMDQLVQQDPRVLAGPVAGASEGIQGFINNVTAATSLLRESMAAGKMPEGISEQSLNSNVTRLTNILKDPQLKPIDALAIKASLFDAQKNVLAYQIGSAFGQDSKALAEVERAMFVDMASKGKDPDTFRQNVANLLVPMVENVDDQGRRIVNNDMASKQFEKTFNRPVPGLEAPNFKGEMQSESNGYKILEPYMTGKYDGEAVAKRAQTNTGAPKSQFREGQTATNPQTKQKMIYTNGAWVPLQ